MLSFFDKVIRWSFYLLFFLVPIIFAGNTSELFEFNKMWLTFLLTLIIAVSWVSLWIANRQIRIRRTPLDIPILLFLVSQGISTMFSIDPHTSLWGYYSRFNGGLYSLIAYGILYFAFVSTIERKDIMKYIYTGIASAIVVALWGLPSHFGYDPTCLIFRGSFDVSCWTFAFQPKVRIFSTLGQPDWLAAYLVAMLPISAALGMIFWKLKRKIIAYVFLATTILFFVDLLYTKARSGMAGFIASLAIFCIVYIAYSWRSFAKHALGKAVKTHAYFLAVLGSFAIFTFLIGTPFAQLDNFSLSGIQHLLQTKQTATKPTQQQAATATPSAIPVQEFGGTDSGKIRLFVWEGALQIFLHNPLFGTGVETFAYSYYKYRPAGHNLTSEWDYLYNKAHNEYLNFLATTGIVGLGTYLFLLGVSLWFMGKSIHATNDMEEPQSKNSPLLSYPYAARYVLLALLAGYVSILITNFFGFSVVIMNVYLFLLPACALLIADKKTNVLTFGKGLSTENSNEIAWIGISIIWILCLYFIIVFIRFWLADVSYALGKNLDQANEYNAAYSYLHDAVTTRPSEPVFQDELAINDSVLATALFQQKDSTNGAKLRDEAIAVSDSLTINHPNVITFWKSRVRIFYTLAQIDPHYLSQALIAIEKAANLAPTDAKVWYNLGLLYDQTGNVDKAISTLERTIQLKPDYRESYYALALFYRQKAVGNVATSKVVKDADAEKKAVAMMHFILQNFGPNDDLKIKDTLSSWGEE